MLRLRHTLFLFLLIFYQTTFCQPTNFRIKSYTLEDGLLSLNVSYITQDSNGFIWISSPLGLVRYDGFNFVHFITDTSRYQMVSKREVRGLFTDTKDNLWVAGHGVERFDKAKNTFFHFRHSTKDTFSLLNDFTHDFFEDSKGLLWVTTWQGISSIDRETGKFFNYSICDCLIRVMEEDEEGNLWLGSFLNGVYKYDRRTNLFHNYKFEPNDKNSIGANNIKDIKCDKQGRIWIATWGGGINLFDKNKNHFIRYYPNQKIADSENNTNAICIDKNDNFWVGTDKGLRLFDSNNGTFTSIKTMQQNNDFVNNYVVNTLFEDKTGNLWIGTRNGLFQLSENKFSNIIFESEDKIDVVASDAPAIYEAENSAYLIDYKTRIEIWNRKNNTFTRYPSEKIIYQDKQKRFWLIKDNELIVSRPYLFNKPLYRFNIKLNDKSSILSNLISKVVTDTAGNFWIGYYQGNNIPYFTIIDKNFKLKNVLIKEFIPDDITNTELQSFGIDKKNNLWLNFWGQFLKINLATRSVKKYVAFKNGPSSDLFDKIYNDSKSRLWLFTTSGVELYDEFSDSFSVFNKNRGLAGNEISGMLEDKNGDFWFATNQGLSHYNLQDKSVLNYSKADGLPSNNLLGSLYIDQMGDIIIVGDHFISSFNPNKIVKNKYVPPVVLTKFQLFNKDVPIANNSPLKESILTAKEITLKYNQSVISFEFAVLNYLQSEKNQYAYFMQGFDKDTNFVGSRNAAHYTNLNPGEYTFHVFGANNDGLWNKKGASVKIIVLPPFWMTWWFRLGTLFFVLLLVIFIFRLRVSVIKNQKKELEKQVQERTAEVQMQASVLREVNLELVDKQKQLQESNIHLEERQEKVIAQNEEIQKQAEELKILNSTKDKFFSIIGHDLKNPFYAINGLASILKEKNEQLPVLQRAEIAAMIEDSSKNAFSLLDNLLTWARSQSSTISFKPESVNMDRIVMDTINLLQVNAEKKNINLIPKLSPNLFAFVDVNMVTTIVRNLINNALKFTGEGGTIIVEGKVENDTCLISVIDNGVGMNEETLNKLFRIDKNVSTKGTSGESGTGLGLIICKEFIDKNNGSIRVQSEIEKGSSFIISLPKADIGIISKQEVEIHEQNSNIKKVTLDIIQKNDLDKFEDEEIKKFLISIKREDNIILIIEDNSEIRMNIKQTLNQYFNIQEAEDGKVGINKAREIVPDLIISDVMMPGTDGFELCSILKTDILTNHIPIILLTARSSEKSKITGINMGADDYITKPFVPNVLLARVKNLIIQRRLLKEKFSKEFILQPTDIPLSGVEMEFLNLAISVIEKNIDKFDFTVDQFSEQMGLSYMQLYRKLESLTGQTPLIFIRSHRLKRAAQMMEKTDLNITEIGLSVGFNDLSHFSKCFKEYFQIPPKQYLLQKKGK